MAKTSKTTKKATASSSVKKKGLLGKSFNLKSRKVQFFVSILVIAIVGAGYFTFKSFAATQLAPGSAANGSLVKSYVSGNLCGVQDYTDPAKGSTLVRQMYCGILPAQTVASTASLASTQSTYLYKGNYYRTCAVMQGTGEVSLGASVTPLDGLTNTRVNSSGYTTSCSNYWSLGTQVSSTYASPHIFMKSISSQQLLRVSSVWFEQGGTVSTAPTPSGGGK